MSTGFARDASVTDEDSSVGETLLHGAQRQSRFYKVAIASVCGATLLSVGFAAGRWQAQHQTLRGKDTIGKSASYEQFGEDFSAATAGKSWPEIHRIQQEVEAGQGALGAAYAALPQENRLGFNNAVSSSNARGHAESRMPITNGPVHDARAQEATSATPSMKAQMLEQKRIPGPKCSNTESGTPAAIPPGYSANTANADKLCWTKPCNFELSAYDRKQCLLASCSTKTTYPTGYVANPLNALSPCKGSVCDFSDADDVKACLSPRKECGAGKGSNKCANSQVWVELGKAAKWLCKGAQCDASDAPYCCVDPPKCDSDQGKKVIKCDSGDILSKDKKCTKNECEATDKGACCVKDPNAQTGAKKETCSTAKPSELKCDAKKHEVQITIGAGKDTECKAAKCGTDDTKTCCKAQPECSKLADKKCAKGSFKATNLCQKDTCTNDDKDSSKGGKCCA